MPKRVFLLTYVSVNEKINHLESIKHIGQTPIDTGFRKKLPHTTRSLLFFIFHSISARFFFMRKVMEP